MHWTIGTGIVFLATAHEPHILGHRKLHQPSELGPLNLLKKNYPKKFTRSATAAL